MKNINPLNPDVKPEEPANTSPLPVTTTGDTPTPTPTPTDSASADTASTSTTNVGIQDPSVSTSLYPTPLTSEERYALHSNTQDSVYDGAVISQIGIPLLVGGTCLYLAFKLITDLLSSAANPHTISILPGNIEWLYITFYCIQIGLALILSYKVFRGSKTALALLTGPILLYIQLNFVSRLSIFIALDSLKLSTTEIFVVLAEITLLSLMGIAWFKEKKAYI